MAGAVSNQTLLSGREGGGELKKNREEGRGGERKWGRGGGEGLSSLRSNPLFFPAKI